MCGEKGTLETAYDRAGGSPPHVRGKAPLPASVPSRERITPACAGKRSRTPRQRITRWDHPRMCGEKRQDWPELKSRNGSPPHVRGKVKIWSEHTPTTRITPACAGKSDFGYTNDPSAADHPRMCGEKKGVATTAGSPCGSPPHVRGKVAHIVSGIIC